MAAEVSAARSQAFAPVDSETSHEDDPSLLYLDDRSDAAELNILASLVREESPFNADSVDFTFDYDAEGAFFDSSDSFVDDYSGEPVTEAEEVEEPIALARAARTSEAWLNENEPGTEDFELDEILAPIPIREAQEPGASKFESTIHTYLRSLGPLPVFTRDQELEAFQEYASLKEQLLDSICTHDLMIAHIQTKVLSALRSKKEFQSLFTVNANDTEAREELSVTLQQTLHSIERIQRENQKILVQAKNTLNGEITGDDRSQLLLNRAQIRDTIRLLPFRNSEVRDLAVFFLQSAKDLSATASDHKQPPRSGVQGDAPLEILASQAEVIFERYTGCRNKIAQHNIRLIMSVIKNLGIFRMDISDQFQEGFTGLLNAIDAFNPSLGYKLSTSAWMAVQRQITSVASTESKVAPLTTYTAGLLRSLHRANEILFTRLSREPDVDELATEMDISPARVAALQKIAASLAGSFSKDQIGNQSGTETSSFELEDRIQSDDQRADSAVTAGLFAIARKFLDSRSFAMIEMRFREGAELEKIGKRFRITRERARQILAEAVKKIQTHYREGTPVAPSEPTVKNSKHSHLFHHFYAAVSGTERPPIAMSTLEQFAGDVNFWHNFFDSNDNYIKFFRVKLAASSGFDISRLSRERQDIFQRYLDERVPTLAVLKRDRAFASILQVPRVTRTMQKAMVDKGWRSPVLPAGASLSVGQNDPSPYVDLRVVSREQIKKNLDRFLKENYPNLDAIHQKSPGIKMIASLLQLKTTDTTEIARYCARSEGPLSQTMPLHLPATRARLPSFYFRAEIVGQGMAYHNAGSWIRHHVTYLHKVRPSLPILRTLLHITDFSSDASPDRFKSPAEVGKELVRRKWLEPRLPLEGHGVQTTKSNCCDPDVTGSEEIAAYNRAVILGRPLPQVAGKAPESQYSAPERGIGFDFGQFR